MAYENYSYTRVVLKGETFDVCIQIDRDKLVKYVGKTRHNNNMSSTTGPFRLKSRPTSMYQSSDKGW